MKVNGEVTYPARIRALQHAGQARRSNKAKDCRAIDIDRSRRRVGVHQQTGGDSHPKVNGRNAETIASTEMLSGILAMCTRSGVVVDNDRAVIRTRKPCGVLARSAIDFSKEDDFVGGGALGAHALALLSAPLHLLNPLFELSRMRQSPAKQAIAPADPVDEALIDRKFEYPVGQISACSGNRHG